MTFSKAAGDLQCLGIERSRIESPRCFFVVGWRCVYLHLVWVSIFTAPTSFPGLFLVVRWLKFHIRLQGSGIYIHLLYNIPTKLYIYLIIYNIYIFIIYIYITCYIHISNFNIYKFTLNTLSVFICGSWLICLPKQLSVFFLFAEF